MALRRDLNLLETAALSIAIMAPTAAMALNGSLAANLAGTGATLAFLGALITVVFIAYAFTTFCKRYATTGSVYAFASRGLGVRVGFLSGWALLFTYFTFSVASAGEVGLFFQTFVGLLGGSVPWILPTLAALALILGLGLRRLELGTRVTLIVEGISITLILITVIVILAHLGTHAVSVKPFKLPSGIALSSVGLASIFGFLSFAGFEGAAVLGEESRNPTRAIPRAIWIAVFGCGVFYLLVIYTQSLGFGLGASGVRAFGGSSDPMVELTGQYAGHAFAVILAAGACVSAYAAAFGSTITTSRLLLTFGRDGLLTKRFAETNSRGAPSIAILASVVLPAVVVVIWFLYGTPAVSIFGDFGTIGVLALLLAYLTTQVAAIKLFAGREWRGPKLIIPIVAIVLIGYAFYANVWPVPAAPGRYFPYIVLLWLIVGLAISFMRPDAIRAVALELSETKDEPTNRSAVILDE
jgi:amino acid transporter